MFTLANQRKGIFQLSYLSCLALGILFLGTLGIGGRAHADQLSIPTGVVGGAGLEAQAPVNVANITAPGFDAIVFNVSYNAAVLTATGAQLGAATSGKGCIQETNNISATEMRVSMACQQKISTAGELLRLVFSVIGAAGATSPLNFVPSTCQIGESATPACTTVNGSLNVVASRTLSGKVIYYNGLATRPLVTDERAVGEVAVNLSRGFTDTTDTAANGTYSVGALQGNLTVQPRKRGGYSNGISALDAAWVAQQVAGLRTLNARQLIAADANGTGGAPTANDASQILRFVVGSITELKMEADCNTAFAFVPAATVVPSQTFQQPNPDVRQPPAGPGCVHGEIRYDPLNANATGQDFIAILIGDVTGNWTPPPPAAAPSFATTVAKPNPHSSAKLSIGKKLAKPGAIVTLPIKIANAQDALGIEVVLQYDENVLLPLTVEKTRLSQNMTLVDNLPGDPEEPGVMRIALSGIEELGQGGVLLQVSFSVIGEQKGTSPVEILDASVNENQAITSHGSVNVK